MLSLRGEKKGGGGVRNANRNYSCFMVMGRSVLQRLAVAVGGWLVARESLWGKKCSETEVSQKDRRYYMCSTIGPSGGRGSSRGLQKKKLFLKDAPGDRLRLAAVGGGWRRLAVSGWWLVGGGWRLAVGSWRLMVPGGCP